MNATSPQMKGAEVAPFTAAASPSSRTAPGHDLAVVDCDSVTALQAVGNVLPVVLLVTVCDAVEDHQH
jgi:hypothetical protein